MHGGTYRFFIGRAQEQEELQVQLSLASRGQGQFVKLLGEPGIGKTWLAEKFAQQARQEGFEVVWGRAWELGGAPPYWPWGRLLESLTESLEREQLLAELGDRAASLRPLLPGWFAGEGALGQGVESESHARFVLYDAVAVLVGQACARQPVLLVLDDIHAFALSSLQLLAYLIDRCRAQRLMVLATCRDVDTNTTTETDELLFGLGRHMGERKLVGFGVAELEDWLVSGGACADGLEAQELLARTGGNPLFVEGLLRMGHSHGQSVEGVLPATIRTSIGRRLRPLPAGVREALEVAAVVRRAFGPRLVAHALDRPKGAVLDALRIAVIEGLIRRADGPTRQYDFTHSLFAEVLEAELSASRRLVLHRAVGEALESLAGGDLEPHLAELARHFLVVAELDETDKGVHYALEAGRQAHGASDYEAAIAFCSQAMELMSAGTPLVEQAEVSLALADALLLAGKPGAARESYQQTVRLLEGNEHCAALTRAALGLHRTRGFGREAPECIGLLHKLLAFWEQEDGAEQAQAQILASLAMAMWASAEHFDQRDTYSARALALTRKGKASAQELAFALTARCLAIWSPDSLAERVEIVQELQGLLSQVDDPLQRFEIFRWTLNVGWESCDFVLADDALGKYCETAEQLRAPQPRMNAALRMVTRAQMAGDFARVYAHIEELSDWGERAGDPQTHLYAAYGAVFPLYHEGRTEELRQLLPTIREAVKVWAGFPGPTLVELSALWMTGLREEAASLYHRYKAMDFAFHRFWGLVHGWVECAEAAILFDDAEGAARLYSLLLPYEERLVWSGIGLPQGVTALHLGRLARFLGDVDKAQAHLDKAKMLLLRIGDPLHLALTRLELVRCELLQDSPMEPCIQELDEVGQLAEEKGYVVLGEMCDQIRHQVRERSTPSGRHAEAQVASTASRDDVSTPAAPIVMSEVVSARVARSAVPAPEPPRQEPVSTLRREGATWKVTFGGKAAQLKALRGVEYIARLLQQPGVELHALDLVHPHRTIRAEEGIEILDEQAKEAYRQRINTLRAALEEAETWNDLERAAQMREELDALTQQLAQAVGLGGRARTTGSQQEKARTSVTRAIKRAQTMIASFHKEFAHHLKNSIKTGVFCSYQPEPGQEVTCFFDDVTM